MNVKFFLSLVLACLMTIDAWAIDPYKAEIIGKQRVFARAKKSKQLKFTIRTAEGRFKAILKPRKHFKPKFTLVNGKQSSDQKVTAKFFKGYVTRKQKTAPASVDIIGDTFRIRFKSLRTGRLYSASIQMKGKPESLARLSHVPSTTSFSCAAETQTTNSRAAAALTGQVLSFDPELSPAITQFLEISTDADYEFFTENGSSEANTFAEIQSILNTAEAFYLDQIGVGFLLRGQNVFTDSDLQPYKSRSAVTLIDQFGCEITGEQHIPAADVFHLFTGKDLNGFTIGIAWVAAACSFGDNQRTGVTQKVNDAIQAIVTAHEIGHNLAADHDNLTDSIMAPVVQAANSSFSTFSIGQITSYIDNFGSCLETDAVYGAKFVCPTPTPTPDPTPTVSPTPKPTATPIPIEPEINLSVSLRGKRKYRFLSSISAIAAEAECSASLFGANRKQYLAKSISRFAIPLIYNNEIGPSVNSTASVKARGGKRKNRNLFFKAVMNCGSDEFESQVIKVKTKLTARIPARKFLKLLRGKVELSLEI
ncbi:MAG: M12 family metallo-peptidase [Bdellovibrionota bacterium]